jgi:hypothetical protein
MLSAQRIGLLHAFLGGLPAHLAARLTKAVEVDRLTDGATLPHDLILDGLRPALRHGNDQRDRTPTPLRLFCRPFEDLLISGPRTTKQKGRIARGNITPVWEWLGTKLIPRETQAYSSELKALLVAFKSDEARARAAAFWTEAAGAITAALSTENGRKAAKTFLKDEFGIDDAREMALLLAVGADILDLQDKLPKPVPAFTEDLVWMARDVYDRFVSSAPDAAPYVAVIVMNRIARRWEALRLPALVARAHQDTLVASTDMGLVGELLFGDIDALSKAVRATKHPRFDVDKLIDNIASFAELSSAVVKEMAVRRDGKWGQGLLKDRSDVGRVMDEFMERAPKEITGALPSQKLSRPVEPEKIERALRYATLIAGCKPFAAAGSFHASLEKSQKLAIECLLRHNEDAVRELRDVEDARRQLVQDQFALAAELTAILCGEQEAELLRRRGRAAQAAAVAAA